MSDYISINPHIVNRHSWYSCTSCRLITTNLVTAKTLNDQGGDWDRRNRLKVYEGLHKMSQREFEDAAPLLIDSIATFTAIELISFERFVFYAVIVGLKVSRIPTKSLFIG